MRNSPLSLISYETFCVIGPVLFMVTVSATALASAFAQDNHAGIIAGHLAFLSFAYLTIFVLILHVSYLALYIRRYIQWRRKTPVATGDFKHPARAITLAAVAVFLAVPVATLSLESIVLSSKMSALDSTDLDKKKCLSRAFWHKMDTSTDTQKEDITAIVAFERLFSGDHMQEKYSRIYQYCVEFPTLPSAQKI